MIPFNQFYEQEILSVTEPIFIEGVGELSAKVDTGNEGYNVLHAINISEIDDSKIRFLTNDKTVVKKIVDRMEIHIGSGHNEDRYVVEFNVKFKNKFYENVPFTLADRSENGFPVLIGEPFLKKIDALVDTNGEQVLS